MDDQGFYEALHRVSSALVWEGAEALPDPADLDSVRTALSDLAGEPLTENDPERLAAVVAVAARLYIIAELAGSDSDQQDPVWQSDDVSLPVDFDLAPDDTWS